MKLSKHTERSQTEAERRESGQLPAKVLSGQTGCRRQKKREKIGGLDHKRALMAREPITATKVDEADLAGAASGRAGTRNTSPQEGSVGWVKRTVAKGLQL